MYPATAEKQRPVSPKCLPEAMSLGTTPERPPSVADSHATVETYDGTTTTSPSLSPVSRCPTKGRTPAEPHGGSAPRATPEELKRAMAYSPSPCRLSGGDVAHGLSSESRSATTPRSDTPRDGNSSPGSASTPFMMRETVAGVGVAAAAGQHPIELEKAVPSPRQETINARQRNEPPTRNRSEGKRTVLENTPRHEGNVVAVLPTPSRVLYTGDEETSPSYPRPYRALELPSGRTTRGSLCSDDVRRGDASSSPHHTTNASSAHSVNRRKGSNPSSNGSKLDASAIPRPPQGSVDAGGRLKKTVTAARRGNMGNTSGFDTGNATEMSALARSSPHFSHLVDLLDNKVFTEEDVLLELEAIRKRSLLTSAPFNRLLLPILAFYLLKDKFGEETATRYVQILKRPTGKAVNTAARTHSDDRSIPVSARRDEEPEAIPSFLPRLNQIRRERREAKHIAKTERPHHYTITPPQSPTQTKDNERYHNDGGTRTLSSNETPSGTDAAPRSPRRVLPHYSLLDESGTLPTGKKKATDASTNDDAEARAERPYKGFTTYTKERHAGDRHDDMSAHDYTVVGVSLIREEPDDTSLAATFVERMAGMVNIPSNPSIPTANSTSGQLAIPFTVKHNPPSRPRDSSTAMEGGRQEETRGREPVYSQNYDDAATTATTRPPLPPHDAQRSTCPRTTVLVDDNSGAAQPNSTREEVSSTENTGAVGTSLFGNASNVGAAPRTPTRSSDTPLHYSQWLLHGQQSTGNSSPVPSQATTHSTDAHQQTPPSVMAHTRTFAEEPSSTRTESESAMDEDYGSAFDTHIPQNYSSPSGSESHTASTEHTGIVQSNEAPHTTLEASSIIGGSLLASNTTANRINGAFVHPRAANTTDTILRDSTTFMQHTGYGSVMEPSAANASNATGGYGSVMEASAANASRGTGGYGSVLAPPSTNASNATGGYGSVMEASAANASNATGGYGSVMEASAANASNATGGYGSVLAPPSTNVSNATGGYGSVMEASAANASNATGGYGSVMEASAANASRRTGGYGSVLAPPSTNVSDAADGYGSVMEASAANASRRTGGYGPVLAPPSTNASNATGGYGSVMEASAANASRGTGGYGSVMEPSDANVSNATGGYGSVMEASAANASRGTGGYGSVLAPPSTNVSNATGGYGSVMEASAANASRGTGGYGSVMEPSAANVSRATGGYGSVLAPPSTNVSNATGGYGSVMEPSAANASNATGGYGSVMEASAANASNATGGYGSVLAPPSTNVSNATGGYGSVMEASAANASNATGGYGSVMEASAANASRRTGGYGSVLAPPSTNVSNATGGYGSVMEASAANASNATGGYGSVMEASAANASNATGGYGSVMEPSAANASNATGGYGSVMEASAANASRGTGGYGSVLAPPSTNVSKATGGYGSILAPPSGNASSDHRVNGDGTPSCHQTALYSVLGDAGPTPTADGTKQSIYEVSAADEPVGAVQALARMFQQQIDQQNNDALYPPERRTEARGEANWTVSVKETSSPDASVEGNGSQFGYSIFVEAEAGVADPPRRPFVLGPAEMRRIYGDRYTESQIAELCGSSGGENSVDKKVPAKAGDEAISAAKAVYSFLQEASRQASRVEDSRRTKSGNDSSKHARGLASSTVDTTLSTNFDGSQLLDALQRLNISITSEERMKVAHASHAQQSARLTAATAENVCTSVGEGEYSVLGRTAEPPHPPGQQTQATYPPPPPPGAPGSPWRRRSIEGAGASLRNTATNVTVLSEPITSGSATMNEGVCPSPLGAGGRRTDADWSMLARGGAAAPVSILQPTSILKDNDSRVGGDADTTPTAGKKQNNPHSITDDTRNGMNATAFAKPPPESVLMPPEFTRLVYGAAGDSSAAGVTRVGAEGTFPLHNATTSTPIKMAQEEGKEEEGERSPSPRMDAEAQLDYESTPRRECVPPAGISASVDRYVRCTDLTAVLLASRLGSPLGSDSSRLQQQRAPQPQQQHAQPRRGDGTVLADRTFGLALPTEQAEQPADLTPPFITVCGETTATAVTQVEDGSTVILSVPPPRRAIATRSSSPAPVGEGNDGGDESRGPYAANYLGLTPRKPTRFHVPGVEYVATPDKSFDGERRRNVRREREHDQRVAQWAARGLAWKELEEQAQRREEEQRQPAGFMGAYGRGGPAATARGAQRPPTHPRPAAHYPQTARGPQAHYGPPHTQPSGAPNVHVRQGHPTPASTQSPPPAPRGQQQHGAGRTPANPRSHWH